MKKVLIKIIYWLTQNKPMPNLTKDQEIGLFAQLYQNPTFVKYLFAREEYLVKKGMDDFINGKIKDATGLSGQLLEIRNLRTRSRSAYLIIDKSKKQSLKKE